MSERIAQRTIVKSPPEVWAEVSDVAALARHLGEFGEIRITRTEPESAVSWAAGELTGTVSLDASGWGTRVTLTATMPAPEPVASEPEPEPASTPEPEPAAAGPEVDPTTSFVPEPSPRGLWSRMRTWRQRRSPIDAPPEPEPVAPPPPEPVVEIAEPALAEIEPAADPALTPERVDAVLAGTLEALGSPRNRPFSRP